MTLTFLLEINKQFLKYEDERALSIAERVWRERGSPRQPGALCETLEAILNHLTERGIYYPKILLLRKKELQRRMWKPKEPRSASPQRPGPDGDPICPDCGGNGINVTVNGTGSFCPCGAGEAVKRSYCKTG